MHVPLQSSLASSLIPYAWYKADYARKCKHQFSRLPLPQSSQMGQPHLFEFGYSHMNQYRQQFHLRARVQMASCSTVAKTSINQIMSFSWYVGRCKISRKGCNRLKKANWPPPKKHIDWYFCVNFQETTNLEMKDAGS